MPRLPPGLWRLGLRNPGEAQVIVGLLEGQREEMKGQRQEAHHQSDHEPKEPAAAVLHVGRKQHVGEHQLLNNLEDLPQVH